jgi:hypothetical protein
MNESAVNDIPTYAVANYKSIATKMIARDKRKGRKTHLKRRLLRRGHGGGCYYFAIRKQKNVILRLNMIKFTRRER